MVSLPHQSQTLNSPCSSPLLEWFCGEPYVQALSFRTSIKPGRWANMTLALWLCIGAVHNSVMRYPSTVHSQAYIYMYMYKRILEYSDAMFFIIFLIFFFVVVVVDFCCCCFFATTIPLEQYPKSIAENACNFTLSCSWRRWFNSNNNSKQCCFKNQRWKNNPFSSKSKQKSGHWVPVSEWLSTVWVLEHSTTRRSPIVYYRWWEMKIERKEQKKYFIEIDKELNCVQCTGNLPFVHEWNRTMQKGDMYCIWHV